MKCLEGRIQIVCEGEEEGETEKGRMSGETMNEAKWKSHVKADATKKKV